MKKIMSKKLYFVVPFLILVLVFSFIGCTNNKDEEVKIYIAEFKDIKDKFIDKYKLANTTARIALTPVISDMQDIKRDLLNLDPPENVDRLSGVKELCLYGMDKVIEGFQEFQIENEIKSISLLREADEIFESVDNTINEIKEELNE